MAQEMTGKCFGSGGNIRRGLESAEANFLKRPKSFQN
jgi:hypothetical protein